MSFIINDILDVSNTDVLFLMPNGYCIELKVDKSLTLSSVKEACWHEAKLNPLFEDLQTASNYVFVGITVDGERVKFYDETKKFCDLRLFHPILKTSEHSGNYDEEIFESKIRPMVGQWNINTLNTSEAKVFQRNINAFCCKSKHTTKEQLLLYHYPPDIYPNSQLPTHLTESLKKDKTEELKLKLVVWLEVQATKRSSFTITANINSHVNQVLLECARKELRFKQREDNVIVRAQQLILKVMGLHEYLLENLPICQYKHIRHCLLTHKTPELVLIDRDDFFWSGNLDRSPQIAEKEEEKEIVSNNAKERVSIWGLNKVKFEVYVAKVENFFYDDTETQQKLSVRVSLLQGQEALCKSMCTKEISGKVWNEWVELDIMMSELPRTARLTFTLCVIDSTNKKKEDCEVWQRSELLFDYDSIYFDSQEHNNNTGREVVITRPMMAHQSTSDDFLPPISETRANLCPHITFHFRRQLSSNQLLVFPPIDEVIQHGQKMRKIPPKHSKRDLVRVDKLKNRDPLWELDEQNKTFLWNKRELFIKKAYNMLPKLVQSLPWNSKDDVAMLQELLTRCPQISADTSFELLHNNSTDPDIRKFAVTSLQHLLTNYHLCQYLLQLVNALECEVYYDNELVRFLLSKALTNSKIGQAFFWDVRCLMAHSNRSSYYGMLLELYLRHCGNIELLSRQVIAVEKMNLLCEAIRAEKEENQVKTLHTMLSNPDVLGALTDFTSPLNPSVELHELDIERCEVKSSKKRPIMLTWKCRDGPISHQVIFKIGDDLRQDMLTLQVFELMNGIWELEGLNVRLLPYRCMSTGVLSGMIEVVGGAVTMMQVVGKGFNSRRLHSWIKQHNPPGKPNSDHCAYTQAIDLFRKSCAGYCVATFVLGIGDRHPSNIMITPAGQVFHIDFGHFLNHRKKKFGINRERVPFVLTEDFIRVIAKGKDNPIKSSEFSSFMQLCGEAYLCLRKHSSLIINLFWMMLGSGMPELRSLEDLEYLRETLMVQTPLDQVALQYFQDRFNEAYGGAWTTKVDWFFHSVKHTGK